MIPPFQVPFDLDNVPLGTLMQPALGESLNLGGVSQIAPSLLPPSAEVLGLGTGSETASSAPSSESIEPDDELDGPYPIIAFYFASLGLFI